MLLGYGHEAPAGWAATWATAFAAVAFAAVPLLLIRTLAWMNPATPHEQRLAQIRAEAYDAVDEEAFERLAYGVLKERTNAAGIELDMFRMAPAFDQRVEVGAAEAGIVRDIRLARLKRVARNLTKKQRGALAITTYLGQYVARSERVAVLPASASAREVRRVEKAFDIDRRTRISRLYGVIGHLHDEALRTIREVKPSEYDDIAELWAESVRSRVSEQPSSPHSQMTSMRSRGRSPIRSLACSISRFTARYIASFRETRSWRASMVTARVPCSAGSYT